MASAPAWAWGVSAALAIFGVLFFFQTKDPMVLIFALIPAAILLATTSLTETARAGGFANVRVKCQQCGALNLEGSRFCSQCGRPM